MKSFSELTSASQVDNADLVAISQSTGNGYASKKTTVGEAKKDIWVANGILGVKNLNSTPYFHGTSRTHKEVTFTVNADGSISTSGTANGGDALFQCHTRFDSDNRKLILPNGNYILSGCASGGSSTKYNIQAISTKNGSASVYGYDYGSGLNFTLNGDDYYTNEAVVGIYITIKNGVNASGLVFRPMIRLASDTDDTFQPYAMTNLELTKAVESGGGTGGHTIIDENGTSMTARSGLQFTGDVIVTDDGTNNKTIVSVVSGGGHNYSTTEQIVGTWIDGSTLYEKTIEFGALPNNTSKTVAYNISNLNNILDVKGIAYNQNGARPLPFVDDATKTGDVLLDTIKSSGVVRIIANTDLSSLTGYVTLQYTKTS